MADATTAIPETPKTPVIPVQETHVEPITVATEAPVTAEDTGTETTTETVASTTEEPRKVEKLPDWAQKIIKDNAFEAREAKREAKRLADELAKRPAATPEPATTATEDEAAARANAPPGGHRTQAEFDEAVRQEANRRQMDERTRSQGQQFGTQLDTIWNTGVEQFKDEFDTIAENLGAVGLLPVPDPASGGYGNDAFMRLVMATDNPAAVLHAYGSDPTKAQALMALTPEKRAIEVAKMDVALSQKKPPAPVTKAPKPVETVEGSPRVSDTPRDDDDDATWFAKRNKEVAERRA